MGFRAMAIWSLGAGLRRSAILGVGLSLFGASAAAACPPLEAADAARLANDRAAAVAAAKAAQASKDCSSLEKQLAGRMAALVTFNRVVDAHEAGSRVSSFAAEIDAALKVGAPWQLLEAAGLAAAERRDYAQAHEYYQLALDDLDSDSVNPGDLAAAPDDVARIYRAASETRLASPKTDKLAARRSSCRIRYRGFSAARKLTPIRFEFDSTDYTDQGRRAFEALAKCLRSVNAKRIRLIGHTDPKGAEEYNDKLSRERAARVAADLAASGLTATIDHEGKGERAPLRPRTLSDLDEETLHRMQRRVEVIIHEG